MTSSASRFSLLRKLLLVLFLTSFNEGISSSFRSKDFKVSHSHFYPVKNRFVESTALYSTSNELFFKYDPFSLQSVPTDRSYPFRGFNSHLTGATAHGGISSLFSSKQFIQQKNPQSKSIPVIIAKILTKIYNFLVEPILGGVIFIINLFRRNDSLPKVLADVKTVPPVETLPVVNRSLVIPIPVSPQVVTPRPLTAEQAEDAKKLVEKRLKEIEKMQKTTSFKKLEKDMSYSYTPIEYAPTRDKVFSVASVIPVSTISPSVNDLPSPSPVSSDKTQGGYLEPYNDPATSVKLGWFEEMSTRSDPPYDKTNPPIQSEAAVPLTVGEETSPHIVTATALDKSDNLLNTGDVSPQLVYEVLLSQLDSQSSTRWQDNAEDIVKTFPAMVSDDTRDPLYMNIETGPVDSFATYDWSRPQRYQNPLEQTALVPDLLPCLDPNDISPPIKEDATVTVTVELPPLSKYLSPDSLVSLKNKVKSTGVSGTIAYIITELVFWSLNAPIIYAASQGNLEGHQAETIAIGAGILTIARLAVPFRLALALALTPLVEDNITRKYLMKDESVVEKSTWYSGLTRVFSFLFSAFTVNGSNGDSMV